MLKAVFFDLDGTLLPMDEEKFIKVYFHLLYEKVKHLGYQEEELIKTIWTGTKLMYINDGSKTNKEVFWDNFVKVYGKENLKHKEIFDDFYLNEFKNTSKICSKNLEASKIIKEAKKLVSYLILSTNPIFPEVGTLTRMSFVDLKKEDFDYITVYENSNFCKPNPNYFKMLLDKFNLKPEEVILFGNNDLEDYVCAKKAGIDCYLVSGCLILHEELKLNPPIIKMDEIIDVIKNEIELRK